MNCNACVYGIGYCPCEHEPTDMLSGYCQHYCPAQGMAYDKEKDEEHNSN